jgi:hypothetical protein
MVKIEQFDNVKLDFYNLEDLEFKLVDIAHSMSVTGDEQFQHTLGRALKCLAPAWIDFLKAEQQRNEENGPGLAVSALIKNYALLTYLLLAATAKNHAAFKLSVGPVSDLFASCIKDFVETTQGEIHDRPQSKAH